MQHKLLFLLVCWSTILVAQTPTPTNGIELSKQNSFILTNVKIYVSPNEIINNGSIVVKNGRIDAIKQGTYTRKDLVLINGNGSVVVPSFIELNSSLGVKNAESKDVPTASQISSKIGPYYWNESIHPEINPSEILALNEKDYLEMQKMGFGLVLVHQKDGIAQGYGSLLQLGKGTTKEQLLKSELASFYSFQKGVSQMEYPSSQVGSIALLRQSFYDADWHDKYGTTTNLSLEALTKQLAIPSFFHTPDKYEFLRAYAISKEFNREFILIGSGQEYCFSGVFDTLKAKMLIPINFPKPFDLKDPYLNSYLDYEDLKAWESAPTNLASLSKTPLQFAITSSGLNSSKDFWSNLHRSFGYGYTPAQALNALTLEPASWLGIQKDYGTLDPGKIANFSVFAKDPFVQETAIYMTVIQGQQIIHQEMPSQDIRGTYAVNINDKDMLLEVSGAPDALEASIKFKGKFSDTSQITTDTLVARPTIKFTDNDVSVHFNFTYASKNYLYSLKGISNSKLHVIEGTGIDPFGKTVSWNAIRIKEAKKDDLKTAWKIDTTSLPKITFPNKAYGFENPPTSAYIVFENATVWTNEAEGIIDNATVISENGKIKMVIRGGGNYAVPAGAKIIDATGKHLTSGIIDEHSHIALSKGVNESGQSITCEVRMGDVINPDDIDIYRQLSGGVTASQLLHGSANAVGGQSALIKLKWGHLPADFIIPNAPKFVKFALGENVKQANWGDQNSIRFPQSRMGVEQVYIDGFNRALEYHKKMEDFFKLSDKQKLKAGSTPPARDLELDALYEIVTGDRRITCHSYIQSEINMLMHVADSFGFKVNTFTHILEGYKVADKMKMHGAGASTFADWWAYKFEVKEAIPQNAAIMNQLGIVVAINSDDAEMGRRLNQEAAKTVKYGGVSEIDAWKMVTLNPAKLLGLDQRMGSVKVGKDADLVLWSTNPLAIDAKVLYTLVDGEILFDRETDAKMQERILEDKTRILSKMNDETPKGETISPQVKKKSGHYHCGTLGEELSEGQNQH